MLPIFEASHKQNKKKKKKGKKKIQKLEKMLEENKKYIYQWEEYTRTPSKLPKTGWGRSKYIKLKNLTACFRLIQALLAKKIQFEEKNFKLDV